MHKLVLHIGAALRDEASAVLFELGVGGLEELDVGFATYGEEAELLRLRDEVAQRLPEAQFQIERVADTWRTAWIDYLRPEAITERIVLQPVGDATPAPAGRLRLVFEPRMAFGVGSHPTTRLAARAVERFCRAHPGARVLDVGTGNGVLALVAAASGASSVLGLDVDPEAVAAASTNAGLNQLDAVCGFRATPLAECHEPADLVVANIDAPTLVALAPELAAALAPGAELVVTGFMADRCADVSAALATHGLAPDRQDSEGEYLLLQLARR